MKYSPSSLFIPFTVLVMLGANLIEPPTYSNTWTIETERDPISFFSGETLNILQDNASSTAPTHKPEEAHATLPFLAHYPFELLEPEIELAEGFAAYDGYLGDPRGDYHRGIDYIRRKGSNFLPFNAFAMHNGEAWRGSSETWGEFVIVRRTMTPSLRYYTVYGHLEGVPQKFPKLPEEPGVEIPGEPIAAGEYVGLAHVTGNTQGVAQLHIELHEENLETGVWVKLDPYGVYNTKSSANYPDPRESLEGLDHYWISNTPSFVR